MWVSHFLFLDCVAQAWGDAVVERPTLLNLMLKLKRLKVALRDWNKNIFRLTEVHIGNLQELIEGLEWDLQEGYSKDIEADLVASNFELSVWMD